MILVLDYKKWYKDENGKVHNALSLVTCEDCGKERKVPKTLVKQNKHKFCNECANKRNIYSCFGEKEYINLSKKIGYKLLDAIPQNTRIKCRWLCNNNHIIESTYHNLDRGHRCKFCMNKNTKTLEEFIMLASKNKIEFIGPYPEQSKLYTYWRCNKGHIFKQRYCDVNRGRLCKFCTFESNRGEGNYNWNPNMTKRDRERRRTMMQAWAKEVKIRDNFTCQRCKSKKKPHSHHIFNFGDYKDLRQEVINGITLCSICHKKFHSKFGLRYTNAIQLNEFLNDPL